MRRQQCGHHNDGGESAQAEVRARSRSSADFLGRIGKIGNQDFINYRRRNNAGEPIEPWQSRNIPVSTTHTIDARKTMRVVLEEGDAGGDCARRFARAG